MISEKTHILGVESILFTPDIYYNTEEKVWLAFLTQLDVATWGDTFEEAKEMLVDAAIAATEFIVEHQPELDGELRKQLPYAKLIYGKTEKEVWDFLYASIHV